MVSIYQPPGLQFIILMHARWLAFFGEIEPYFNRSLMVRDLLCINHSVRFRSNSKTLRILVMSRSHFIRTRIR